MSIWKFSANLLETQSRLLNRSMTIYLFSSSIDNRPSVYHDLIFSLNVMVVYFIFSWYINVIGPALRFDWHPSIKWSPSSVSHAHEESCYP